VCFHSDYVYPFFADRRIEFAGGAEALVAMLARGLAGRGYDVRIVTCDYGQPARQRVDGVTLLRSFVPRRGIRVLRYFHPRLTLATRALLEADAEVYYSCGGGLSSGLAHDVSRLKRAAFVLAMATDYDVVPELLRQEMSPLDRWWYRRGVRDADAVLAQTEFQRGWLERAFGVSSRILPNVVEIPGEAVDAGQEGIVMWLGTYKAMKRPEWFIELARRLPRHRFVMAGVIPPPPLTREAYDQACRVAAEHPNLEVRGFQSPAELDELRRRASLVVHTSPVEGFSNVLIESWALGLPTVSAVDPDGLIARHGLGGVAQDVTGLVEMVSRMMDDPVARRAAGARARAYSREHHAPDVVLGILEQVLDEQIARVRRRRGGRRTASHAGRGAGGS
jgi:glycosyltransferase involved in cell wall biosynthesis